MFFPGFPDIHHTHMAQTHMGTGKRRMHVCALFTSDDEWLCPVGAGWFVVERSDAFHTSGKEASINLLCRPQLSERH